MLTREEILTRARCKTETVDCALGKVTVREMTGRDRDRYELLSAKPTGFRAALILLCAVDADGKSLFNESDLEAIASLPTSVSEPIAQAAQRLTFVEVRAVGEASASAPSAETGST